ncbi:TPA: DUF551 domain-containing protein [Klebsiella variicola]
MALAAMDSEPVELPLDYLQGHKDGLEWAAQLAEANHPDTGDWLYDDPIELAKAIRKGPDMQPAQPVEDSEPDRNPVLAYADSYRDMAKQGVESVPIWSVITDIERNIAPLYRHAQPALVVPPEQHWDELCRQHPDMSIGDAIIRAAWWNHCRAAMLAAAQQSPGSEPATVQGKWIPVSERMPEDEQEVLTINKMGHRFVSFFDKHSGLFFDRLDAPAACCIEHVLVTHWMPLPAGPQEVKGE